MKKKATQNFIEKTSKKIQQLQADVDMHDRLYYRENNPKISDFEYDCLKAELLRLKQLLKNVGIDTSEDKVGNDLIDGFQKHKHLSVMQSLSNTYSYEEILSFDTRIRKQLENFDYTYVVEPKIDGIAINLIYKHGNLERALTRGDGVVGDDVTNNILTINKLPTKIVDCPDILEIRGEIFIDEQTFKAENEHRQANGLEEYANPRNLAAGTVKSLDPSDVKKRNLKAIFYAVGYSSNSQFSTQMEVLKQLSKWGFPSQERYWHAKNISEAWNSILQLNLDRKTFKYWTDGAVLKINELNLHNKLGSTAKAPRWSIAYKFAPTRVSTKLEDIVLQVGRTGVVTPVAILSPIEIDGSIITRATLHNANEIAKKDIRIGDYVFLEKAGEIIPAIVSVDMSKRQHTNLPYQFPRSCPSCQQSLIRVEEEVAWRCINHNCPEQLKCRIIHFISKEGVDIDSLGEVVIQKLIESQKIRNIADIYRLTYNDLANLPKLGQKSALKTLNNIDKSKNCSIWRIINGLGILGVGKQTAKDLANSFHSVLELSHANAEQLATIPGVGQKVAETIVKFFEDKTNQKLIEQLEQLGVSLIEQPIDNKEDIKLLRNKTFVLTGTLNNYTRTETREIIESMGGRVVETVSKKTNIVIVGNNPGSKLSQAEKLSIPIWTEEEFTEQCRSIQKN